jgi:hypothetical protein
MRARQLARDGSPALQTAVKAGLITAYRGGEISRLPLREQEMAVEQWTNRSLARTQGQAIAVKVIRGFLTGGPSISLDELATAIRDAIVSRGRNHPRLEP